MTSTRDYRIEGLNTDVAVKAPCRVATTANITLSGTQTIDDVAVVAEDRVLVKNQTDATENGIYVVKANSWERAKDFNGPRDVVKGTQVIVSEGTVGAGQYYRVTTSNTITIGTSEISFSIISFPATESVLADISAGDARKFATVDNDETGASWRRFLGYKGSSIASATTTEIGDADSDFVSITGTTTITSLGSADSATVRDSVWVQFDGVLTLTHNGTSLILPTAANITTAAGDVAHFVRVTAGNWKCLNYIRANGLPLAFLDEDDLSSDSAVSVPSQQSVKAYVDSVSGLFARGLVPTLGADAAHDVSISAGQIPDSTFSSNLVLPSAMVKQIDATWAAGTNAGGLFSGSVTTNTWYHMFLIEKDSDASIDAGWDIDANATNIPTGYTKYRRIASMKTDGSSNLVSFVAYETPGSGLSFRWSSIPTANLNTSVSSGVTSTVTLTTPTGYVTEAIVHAYTSGATVEGYVFPLSITAETPSASAAPLGNFGDITPCQIFCHTNTSAQIGVRVNNPETVIVCTVGWIDARAS